MPMLRVNGLNLHYEQEGKGPPVLFVHGSVLNGAMTWSAQQPLAERWSLIVIDRPGFGASSPVDRVDFAADAESVAALLDRSEELWGVDRVHLVGHSDGGVVSSWRRPPGPRPWRRSPSSSRRRSGSPPIIRPSGASSPG
ncbi:alpha/beta fold hydrolase [Nocardiopsis composta]